MSPFEHFKTIFTIFSDITKISIASLFVAYVLVGAFWPIIEVFL